MSGEHDGRVAPPEVMHGPKDRKLGPEYAPSERVPDPRDSARLGPLGEQVNLDVQVGHEQTFVIAAPFLLDPVRAEFITTLSPFANSSQRSAFRDQLGLDPDAVLAKENADALTLESPAEVSLPHGEPPPPIRVRFKPTRAGRIQATVTVSATSQDGATDTKHIRITANAYELQKLKAHPEPEIVNEVKAPDPAKGMEPSQPDGIPKRATLAAATQTARNQVTGLANAQMAGVHLAADEIRAYSRALLPKSAFDSLIELAIGMGVAGIAGVVAKYLAKQFASAIANRNSPSTGAISGDAPSASPEVKANEHLQTLVADGVKDGLKNVAKNAMHTRNSTASEGEHHGNKPLSTNWQIAFIGQHELAVGRVETQCGELVNSLEALLGNAEPSAAGAAMEVVAGSFNAAASSAAEVQARATEFQYLSATAKHGLGTKESTLPDGSKIPTANLDAALSFGESGPLAVHEGTVPKHDGVLDIHVEVPIGDTPVETSAFKVRSASLIGISQEIADRINTTDLGAAGIPIRLVVHGHDALITRDEIGNVRVHGYLRTRGLTKWTEAQMHKGAKLLVDKVIAKTLAEWGIGEIKTDDATGRNPTK